MSQTEQKQEPEEGKPDVGAPQQDGLHKTRWTFVRLGRSPDNSCYEEAWRYLYATYRDVIVNYFNRHAPDSTTAAEWSDEFMAAWVLGKLDGADQTKGRFRHYLSGALRNFRYKRYRSLSSKRGWSALHRVVSGSISRLRGKTRRISSLHENVEDPNAEEAEKAFDKDYVDRILKAAFERLRQYQEERNSRGNPTNYFTLLHEYHVGPASVEFQPTYQELAERYGLTEKAVERQLDHARKKLRGWIMSELRETVSTEEELQEEVQLLLDHCRGALRGCV